MIFRFTKDYVETIPCREISDPKHLCRNPVVSVVLLAHNVGPYIEEAVSSVAEQDCSVEYEILLGENGSTDGTREKCIELQRSYADKVRLLQTDEDIGFMRNMLKIRHRMRGRYHYTLDGDDYWCSKTKIQAQVEALEQNPQSPACLSATQILIERQNETPRFDSLMKPSPLKPSYTLDEIVSQWGCCHHSSVLFRNYDFDLPVWYSCCPAADIAYLSFYLSRGPSVFIDDTTTVYRMSDRGVWTTKDRLDQLVDSVLSMALARYYADVSFRSGFDLQTLDWMFTTLDYIRPGTKPGQGREELRRLLSLRKKPNASTESVNSLLEQAAHALRSADSETALALLTRAQTRNDCNPEMQENIALLKNKLLMQR